MNLPLPRTRSSLSRRGKNHDVWEPQRLAVFPPVGGTLLARGRSPVLFPKSVGDPMQRAHPMPFGAEMTAEGVRFALWAPTAREVRLVLDGAEQAMAAEQDGWHRAVSSEARAGGRQGLRT